jgi:hypothetical protein
MKEQKMKANQRDRVSVHVSYISKTTEQIETKFGINDEYQKSSFII